jgi:hypothetical protein
MAEAKLAQLFVEALDRVAYALTFARLWLFDLIHGPEPPTPADEKRDGVGSSVRTLDSSSGCKPRRGRLDLRSRPAGTRRRPLGRFAGHQRETEPTSRRDVDHP